MATQIGVIKALIGEVTATAADGSTRTLQLGDMVYANELISTGTGGAVEIEFADGSVMDLGRSSQAMLDDAVFDPTATAVADAPSDDVPDDVAAIQQALLEGEDPTEVGEATAAGAGVSGTGNEGHEPVFVDYLNPEVTPDAGFDTVGVSNTFDQPEEDIIILEEEEEEPTGPVVSVSVDVEIEIDEQEPPQTEPPTDGVPTPDYPVLVEGNAASVLEGTSEGTKQVVFIINLSEAFSQDVDVTYELRPVSDNGAADNPDDWFDGISPQTVTIPAGSTSFPVYVEIVEDHLDEGNGTFEIVLVSATNATINPDADSATVTIYDDDTTPVAQDDFNAVAEDNAGQPYDGFPSTSGNVISGANDAGNDPAAQEDTDQDGDALEIVSFSDADEDVAAGNTITGEYGELTLNSDGSYTYVLTTNDSDIIQGLSDGETLTDVFSYVVTDTYNAEQTADLTIVIEGTDDGVVIRGLDAEGAEEFVYEANLADGSDPDAPALTQPGSFDFDAPDGFGDTGSVSIGGQSFTLAQLQALGGANVDIPSSYGVLTLTGYTGDEFGGSVSYEYTLTDNVDNDSQADADDFGFTDSFAVVVTDDDGSSANGSLDVQINDDEPTANDDGPVETEEDTAITIAVQGNDVAGADGVDFTDGTKVFVSGGGAANGNVVYNDDGTFTYTPDEGFFGQDSFEYTITDNDGDTDTAVVTIDIVEDAEPTVSVTDGSVDEAALSDGSNPVSDAETTTGSFTIMTGSDSLAVLLVGGVDVTGGGIVNGTYGDLTVTETDGDYTWSYTLSDNTTDHNTQGTNVDGVMDEFSVTVEDNDGDVSPADTLTIQVIDDVPSVEVGVVDLSGLGLQTDDADTVSGTGVATADVDFAVKFAEAVTPEYGADGAGSTVIDNYTLSVVPNDGATGLTSGGAAITLYSIAGVVYASTAATLAEVDINTNTVLTFEVDNTGTVTLTQYQPVDHLGVGNDDVLTLPLDLVNLSADVTITDADGDVSGDSVSTNLNFDISVIDDEPVFTLTNDGDNDGIVTFSAGNADATYNDQFADWNFGADGFGSYSLVDNSTGGTATINSSDADSVVIDLKDGDGVLVGQLTLNADGTDSLETFSREYDSETISLLTSAVTASGPEAIKYILTPELEVEITGTDLVNPSTQGWAISDNQVDEGESITFAFTSGGPVSNFSFITDGYTGNPGTVGLNITVAFADGESETYFVEVASGDEISLTDALQFPDFGTLGVGTATTNDFTSVTIESDLAFQDHNDGFRINNVDVTTTSNTPPEDLAFDFTLDNVTDGDGDTVSQDFSVVLGGDAVDPELVVEAIAGTSGDDILIGTDGDDIFIGGLGDDEMAGGDGADTFIINSEHLGSADDVAADTITDFDDAEDVLDLSDVLASGNTIEGVDNGGHLQIQVLDTDANLVQTIDLNTVNITTNATDALNSLLSSGAVDDGI